MPEPPVQMQPWTFKSCFLHTCKSSTENLSNNEDDSDENVTLEKWIRAYSTSLNLLNAFIFFWRWIRKDCIEVEKKKKKVVVLGSRASSKKSEIRHFYVAVVQWRERNVPKPKCVMQVQVAVLLFQTHCFSVLVAVTVVLLS